MEMKIPFAKPYFTEEEIRLVTDTIATGWVVQGPRVVEFERMVTAYTGARYAAATSSCTAALHLALLLMGVRVNDEVICPSYTFVATANAVIYVGAKPILVEIDPKTYNIEPSKIEEAVTEKTKAVIVVHQVGLPADMEPILEIGNKYRLKIIEDAACALGALYKQKRIGIISELTAFSFHPRKIITTGEGGMLTTNRRDLAERAQILRSHGASISDFERHGAGGILYEKYIQVGYNYRMTDLQAALGIAQMQKIDCILERRRKIADRYNKLLSEMEEIEVPFVPPYATHTYQSYIVRLRTNTKCKADRDEIVKQMAQRGVSCRRGIPPIHLEPYYQEKYGEVRLPITEEVSKTTFILPIYAEMTFEEQDYVVKRLKDTIASR